MSTAIWGQCCSTMYPTIAPSTAAKAFSFTGAPSTASSFMMGLIRAQLAGGFTGAKFLFRWVKRRHPRARINRVMPYPTEMYARC